jgi:hypothetical protein
MRKTDERMDSPDPDKTVVKRTKAHDDLLAARVRQILALMFTGLIAVIAIIAAAQIGAMPVLDKMLPLVTLILGFFFGRSNSS